ncbi:MAG: aminopeptidase [Nanobdellota archaeon]
MVEKSKNEKLKEKLFYKTESSWLKIKNEEEIFKFSEDYKEFLKKSKTERLCASNIIEELEKKNFTEISKKKKLSANDKIYKNIKGKAIIAGVIGKKPDKLKIIGSHMDSPRLDLKPNPLYEESGFAMLQSHYYGGIKKYHWVNVPLSLQGVIFTKSGKKIEMSIGENEEEPKFIIPDLLPHLARDQMKKEASKAVEGEQLNILFGNLPVKDEKIDEKIKFAVLEKLHSEYGIVEEDFTTAELEFVPAAKPVDIGLDRSIISAYGQDDRACVYTSMKAILETNHPESTAIALFVDKEEIGSYGDTSAQSYMLQTFLSELTSVANIEKKPEIILEKAKAISADGTVGMDPTFREVNDPQNVSYLGRGVSIEKYGGGGGKYSTNDAHAEYMQYIRNLCEKNKINWQTGELGKIDIGGGGTIAMFLSRYGMDCLDAGPCILGMHSTNEITSKADIYSCYKLYKAFFNNLD